MMTTDRPDLSNAVQTVKLICVDPTENHNKQWAAWVLPSGDLYVEYGRVNYPQRPHTYACRSVAVAQNKLRQLLAEKHSKGYTPVEVDEQPESTLDFCNLGAGYADQIQERMNLLNFKAQTIMRFSAIEFDTDKGLFQTQMGVISRHTIAQARIALRQIEQRLDSRSGFNDHAYLEAVSEYLSAIPLKVGMKLEPRRILGNAAHVNQQAQVLDTLGECLNLIAEVRMLIETAISNGSDVGSDERARWLHWGDSGDSSSNPETGIDETRFSGEERAQWVRW